MDCIFCKIINGDISSYKIYEDDFVMAFLDINPSSVGHTLVIPKEHTTDIFSIDEDTLKKLNEVTKHLCYMIEDKLGADGFTLIQNNGIAQDVKHYHLHIIPKYKNKVKIDIEDVYKKLSN